jgi:hypothetical protein
MLHHRHQFDVREAHFLDVGGQLMSHFTVAQRAVVVLGNAPPGTEMHFVDRQRRIEGIDRPALGHPFAVAPAVVEGAQARSAAWRLLGLAGKGVGFLLRTVPAADLELVAVAQRRAGDETLPDARMIGATQKVVIAGLKIVEVADHRHVLGIGCPDAELETALAPFFRGVRAETVVEPGVLALAKEVDVLVAEQAVGKDGFCDFHCVPPGCCVAPSMVRCKDGLEPSLACPG